MIVYCKYVFTKSNIGN